MFRVHTAWNDNGYTSLAGDVSRANEKQYRALAATTSSHPWALTAGRAEGSRS